MHQFIGSVTGNIDGFPAMFDGNVACTADAVDVLRIVIRLEVIASDPFVTKKFLPN